MIILVIMFDIFSIVPIVNWITNPIAWFTLWMLRDESSVNLFSEENLKETIVVGVIEQIPGPASLPWWTVRYLRAKQGQKAKESGEEPGFLGLF